MRPLSSDPNAVFVVALAIARVVARKAVQDDPQMRRMDRLGQLSAAETMATNMAVQLRDEALAALKAVDGLDVPEPETVP